MKVVTLGEYKVSVPDKAKYVARDFSGAAHWFTHKPKYNLDTKCFDKVEGECGEVCPNWTQHSLWYEEIIQVEDGVRTLKMMYDSDQK